MLGRTKAKCSSDYAQLLGWGGGVARQGAFSNSFCALRCNASFLVMLPFDFWRNSDLFEKKNIFLAQKLTKLEQFQPNGAPAHSLNACKAPRPVKSQTVKVDPPPSVIFDMF